MKSCLCTSDAFIVTHLWAQHQRHAGKASVHLGIYVMQAGSVLVDILGKRIAKRFSYTVEDEWQALKTLRQQVCGQQVGRIYAICIAASHFACTLSVLWDRHPCHQQK